MKARVLVLHNAYQQRGGEDAVVESEIALLRAMGHEVELLGRHNDAITAMPRLRLAATTVWSSDAYRDVVASIQRHKPAVVHVHNTFPLLSPSVYRAAQACGVPVVQTLHNFRLLCPQAMFLREGRVCEDCLGAVPWRGVVRGCYRGSVAQTAVLAGMLQTHRALGTWQTGIDRYIALNEFCRQKFIAGGLPADRVVVKPNFVEAAPLTGGERGGFLYVGRLSEEKGISVLANAAAQVGGLRLSVVGTGPMAAAIEGAPGCHMLGALPGQQVLAQMQAAAVLVLPSIWYENFPRTLVEAFASGLPVIASRIGALAELVEDGRNGLLFAAGDAQDLAAKLKWAQAHPEDMAKMGHAARQDYERLYTPEVNYLQLMAIYQDAVQARQQAKPH